MSESATLFTALETKAAELLGKLFCPGQPLQGKVSRVFLSRAKLRDVSLNIIENGYKPANYFFENYDEVYEVVYQCWLLPRKDLVLSLFEEQLNLVGKNVEITRYSCVNHLFQRLLIGADLEIYPAEVKVLP